jgi:hypothetical protein
MKQARSGEFAKMGGSSLTGQYAIASVFCKHVLNFSCYSKYVQNYCHAKLKLEELCGKRVFEKWLKGIMSKPEWKRMDIDALMILPIQVYSLSYLSLSRGTLFFSVVSARYPTSRMNTIVYLISHTNSSNIYQEK